MHTQTVLLYLLTWSLVALAPGPAVMCAMTQASRYGLRPAMMGIAGIQLGHLVFFACIASGLAALLPQFIQPGRALALQLVVLLAITIAVDVLVLTAYAFLALRGAQSVRKPGVTVWLERAFGGALVFFGIRLLTAMRMDT